MILMIDGGWWMELIVLNGKRNSADVGLLMMLAVVFFVDDEMVG